ncbi:Marine sediment metagenome DNA, contig: S01H1_L03602 (Fragment) OS=marine sediment metagenome GN=S01H1_10638 PE=4 SV=1: DUF1802 [Gemmataceae bacterium]
MLAIAFKEWAAVCGALAAGRQTVILRKAGIAEAGDEFTPEHPEFLLYPTFFHEHRVGVKPEFAALFDAAETSRPPAGTIRFTHLVRVTKVQRVTNLDDALALDRFHVWTPDVVKQRFHYRTPGLFALTVRVFALAEPHERPERPEYAGCKTWVELDAGVPTAGATPVLTDDEFTRGTP